MFVFFWELFLLQNIHAAPDSRMNRMNGIRFTQNRQNTRSLGKLLAGNPTRPPAPVAWLPVGRRSSSQVTSTMSIPFSEWMSVLLEIEIPCILLFLNRNRNNQNSPKRMQPNSDWCNPSRLTPINKVYTFTESILSTDSTFGFYFDHVDHNKQPQCILLRSCTISHNFKFIWEHVYMNT